MFGGVVGGGLIAHGLDRLLIFFLVVGSRLGLKDRRGGRHLGGAVRGAGRRRARARRGTKAAGANSSALGRRERRRLSTLPAARARAAAAGAAGERAGSTDTAGGVPLGELAGEGPGAGAGAGTETCLRAGSTARGWVPHGRRTLPARIVTGSDADRPPARIVTIVVPAL